MITDPISDMLTRIRNGARARKAEVLIPFSRIKFEIAKLLKHENFLTEVETITEGNLQQIKVVLKYEGKTPVLKEVNRISTPGRRVYAGKDELPIVLNHLGIAVISTSQGIMTNKQARRAGLGGEVLCELW